MTAPRPPSAAGTPDVPVVPVVPRALVALARARKRFCAALAALMLVMLCVFPASLRGDAVEYTLTAIAFADHATPDIRPADLARAATLLPALAPAYAELAHNMTAGRTPVHNAFARGADGKVYQLHFFAYAALAALPLKVFAKTGVPVLKAFQVVNLAFVFALGLALYTVLGTARRAFAGLALFLLSGGVLYWSWSSPECMSAAALLAALLLYTVPSRDAANFGVTNFGVKPGKWTMALGGALFAGAAALQNPTIVFFFGFAPLLQLCVGYRRDAGIGANLATLWLPHRLAALGAGAALAALPIVFNLATFGVPSLVAELASERGLVSLVRLGSFFLDPNQGMIVGLPAVLAAMLLWGWRTRQGDIVHLPGLTPQILGDVVHSPGLTPQFVHLPGLTPKVILTALGAAFTLALALPTLAVHNWNSDAAGMMRYTFWAAMPLLFVLLLRLHQRARTPRLAFAVIALAQAAAMGNAASYAYLDWSPAARLALTLAPALYHPEPEIFAERSSHADGALQRGRIFVATPAGPATSKTLYDTTAIDATTRLCGAGRAPSVFNRVVDSADGWRYIDGPLRCDRAAILLLTAPDFRPPLLADGWTDHAEFGGGHWDGVWSNGARSRVVIPLRAGWRPGTLDLLGFYIGANHRTRVLANGIDLGWVAFDRPHPLELPAAATAGTTLTLDFVHEAPVPAAGAERRALALFLRAVSLH